MTNVTNPLATLVDFQPRMRWL